ncbi:MAG TPA: hypothetical protein VM891_00385 [Amaricoccus sp.]|nr:hypothetical protein [Amaricoccus sp.]
MLDPSTVTGSANPSEDSTAWTAVIPTTTASGLPVTPRGTRHGQRRHPAGDHRS